MMELLFCFLTVEAVILMYGFVNLLHELYIKSEFY